MKNVVFSEAYPVLKEEFNEETAKRIMDEAEKEFLTLCNENASSSKAVKQHTEGKIYPAVGIYHALLNEGVENEKAVAIVDDILMSGAEKQAKGIRAILKIPGFYKLMPKIYIKVAKSSFGEKQGFKATFYDMGPDRAKFDMTKCLYCDTCKKLDCMDIAKCFCHTDDITSGQISDKLIWDRHQTMGDGAPCCDFDLYIKK